ncbi:MAG: hypothetical protein ACREDW_07330 [Aestuariivirgaceae bacterium]
MLGRKPLDFIMRQFYDAMELLRDYDREQSFAPNADQLVLLETLEKQLLDCYIFIHKLRERAKGLV